MQIKFIRGGSLLVGAFLIAVIIYVWLWIILANLDLSAGRFALDMDERISFDGIEAILHPETPRRWLESIAIGFDQDLRYGRGFWNFNALFSYLPEKVWGAPGQIVTTRVVGALALLASYMILSAIVTNRSMLRIAMVLTLTLLPTNIHYATTPKPEPLELLAIAAFLYFWFRKRFIVSTAFLLLGFAWGLKISAAPIVVIAIATTTILILRSKTESGQKIVRISEIGIWFIAGWVICTPAVIAFLWPIVVLLLFAYTVSRLYVSRKIPSAFGASLIFVGSVVITSATVLVIQLVSGLKETRLPLNIANNIFQLWKRWNEQQTGAGGVTLESVFSWLRFGAEVEFGVNTVVLGFAVLLCISPLLMKRFLRIEFGTTDAFRIQVALTLMVLGLGMLAVIVLSVTRLWDFYLHLGVVLLVVGILGIPMTFIEAETVEDKPSNPAKLLSMLAVIAVTVGSIATNLERDVNELSELSQRTNSGTYELNLQDNYELSKRFSELYNYVNRQIDVAYDPVTFAPDSNEMWTLEPIWGKYDWTKAHDAVVIGAGGERDFVAEATMQKQFCTSNIQVAEPNCYFKAMALPSGGTLFLKNTFSFTS